MFWGWSSLSPFLPASLSPPSLRHCPPPRGGGGVLCIPGCSFIYRSSASDAVIQVRSEGSHSSAWPPRLRFFIVYRFSCFQFSFPFSCFFYIRVYSHWLILRIRVHIHRYITQPCLSQWWDIIHGNGPQDYITKWWAAILVCASTHCDVHLMTEFSGDNAFRTFLHQSGLRTGVMKLDFFILKHLESRLPA